MNGLVDAVQITILVDNLASEGLAAEHGLAIWIEASDRRILFDTGQGAALPHNAEKLGTALDRTDFLVLSHGHYDHTGAMAYVLARAPDVHVYCHPSVILPRYSVADGRSRWIQMPDAAKTAMQNLHPERLHRITKATTVFPGVGVTGPVPRCTDFEDTGGPFFLDAEGRLPDRLDDDMALWIETPRGLVLCVGCCHAGLINTLDHACRVSSTPRIHAIIGGFHLGGASQVRLDRTIGVLLDLAPDLVVPCHCTGARAVHQLELALGERVQPGHAGVTFTFGSAP